MFQVPNGPNSRIFTALLLALKYNTDSHRTVLLLESYCGKASSYRDVKSAVLQRQFYSNSAIMGLCNHYFLQFRIRKTILFVSLYANVRAIFWPFCFHITLNNIQTRLNVFILEFCKNQIYLLHCPLLVFRHFTTTSMRQQCPILVLHSQRLEQCFRLQLVYLYVCYLLSRLLNF